MLEVEEAQEQLFAVRQKLEEASFFLHGLARDLKVSELPEEWYLMEPEAGSLRWWVHGRAVAAAAELLEVGKSLFETARLTDGDLRDRWLARVEARTANIE